MNEARSIKQNPPADALPNFRSLGAMLRILLFGNALALTQALVLAGTWEELLARAMEVEALFTPVLLSSLLLLAAVQPWLERWGYWAGVAAICALVAGATLAIYFLGAEFYHPFESGVGAYSVTRLSLLACAGAFILLMHFRWRNQELSLALHDSRLQALRARIRPHFLFNTLNAVLSIVRMRPDKAEAALEDMADLFRMAMSEEHDLVPLSREIELGRQYIALEQLRLGERLRVDWKLADISGEVLIPPLLLQPLLENAVYHGIEPLPQGGVITVALECDGRMLRLKVANPSLRQGGAAHAGNRMALRNIRERLALMFDVEASYRVEEGGDDYRVEIVLPCLREEVRGNR